MRYSRRYVWLPLAIFLLLRLADGLTGRAPSATVRLVSTLPGSHWVATWGASPEAATIGSAGFRNATIREIVLTSAGGYRVRVRLTNAVGRAPLRIGRAAVAVQARGASPIPGTVNPLYFHGRRSVLIAPGVQATSDPVALAIGPATHLAISVFLPGPTGPATQHADAGQVSYVAAGPHVSDGAGQFTARTDSWAFLAGVDVLSPRHTLGAVVALGDSITDGWPAFLARRLNARSGSTLAVIDEGIGGNQALSGASGRFERDAAGQPGARDVILAEGIDTLSRRDDVSRIIQGYERTIALAHMAGLRIFGATLTPFKGSRHWTPADESRREAINHWIRTAGAFDGVIDFATALADPREPIRLAPAFDSGDHLHPNVAGYRAMAATINLGVLLGGNPDQS